MLNNQKDKLFSKKVIETFLENEYKSSIKKNDKFSELAFSIAYYLKSFSNIKKLLDYICLIFKHIFDQRLIIIIPLNEKGEIVGVVVSTLNAQYFYENNSVIPQNINFAIKSDYVSNLISIFRSICRTSEMSTSGTHGF